jgi:cytochrome c biogenesis protein CcdA
VSLSFIRGLVAAVNPCGFILLPTYLMYFLGIQRHDAASAIGVQRASVRRALLVSAAVSAGFLAVFFVAGLVSWRFTSWIDANSKYATVGIGIALIVLGVSMLFGYRLPFTAPEVKGAGHDRTLRAMFVFGVAYAVASIGCTIGLFIATVFSASERDGVLAGVANMVAYGAGMALLVSALTIALASANTGLLTLMRRSLRYVDRVAAVFVVMSGTYLLWYFYWVDLREVGDPITDWAQERQVRATVFLSDHWRAVAVALVAVVGGAIAFVWFTGDRTRPVVADDRAADDRAADDDRATATTDPARAVDAP